MRRVALCFFVFSSSLCASTFIYADKTPDMTTLAVTKMINANNAFFIGAGLGMNWLSYGQTSNSIYYTPYPYFDAYHNSSSSTGTSLAADFGYRWAKDLTYSLGLRYEHLLSNKINGNILILNNPAFPYNFSANTSSNALLMFGKVDLTRLWSVSPYASIGVGFASNTSQGYEEAPANNATPRNVTFGANSTIGFAYDVGVGLDYRFKKHYLLSVGYDYESLGNLQSGAGSHNYVNNANNHLNFGKITASRVLAELNYLFK